ncbi:tetratricopeptide repeat-containing sulfotransferase family protein [Dyella sp.]|jgi:tetratricopeptide (TPR) repeat protein|uniref:tetratricopeptide repeat-containing sulfotransferase family protein n=1 Tax=Dyella sp. TaxID=1869338 RepID=UPI002D79815D|nr:sulfotransferase [Dyella sp.]HET6431891.1 sulfotransferase [Dyella sp.]
MTEPGAIADAQRALQRAQTQLLQGNLAHAAATLDDAMAAHPQSDELALARAGVAARLGDSAEAAFRLRRVLDHSPGHVPAALMLARSLREAGQMRSAGEILLGACRTGRPTMGQRIDAVELLDDCGRQADALELCLDVFAAGGDDPRLRAHAGALAAQLGRFEEARQHQQAALAGTSLALEWHVPLGLAGLQRYCDPEHPDIALFERLLTQGGLSAHARSGLLFALGKARDDLGEHARAAAAWADANRLVHERHPWNRKQWRRSVEMRLTRPEPPALHSDPRPWTPVFIVGMPRSGSTLLAEQLARHALVRHRGELPWLPTLAARLASVTSVHERSAQMEAIARSYEAQLVQDDAAARWYIDKQPHNYLHVDLILALFPQARIIHCRRDPRDTALSLWMQSFHPGTQDFAFDFADIACAIQGSRRLMAHWQRRYPLAVREVRYEELVDDTAGCIESIAQWLRLPTDGAGGAVDEAPRAISTASLWQVRQPVHRRSVQRWRNYAQLVPELARLPTD